MTAGLQRRSRSGSGGQLGIAGQSVVEAMLGIREWVRQVEPVNMAVRVFLAVVVTKHWDGWKVYLEFDGICKVKGNITGGQAFF